jgi:hypothetical protein
MIREGVITQEEGMQNADSPSNLIWLLNNTEAGVTMPGAQQASVPITPNTGGIAGQPTRQSDAPDTGGASFTEITLITEDIK